MLAPRDLRRWRPRDLAARQHPDRLRGRRGGPRLVRAAQPAGEAGRARGRAGRARRGRTGPVCRDTERAGDHRCRAAVGLRARARARVRGRRDRGARVERVPGTGAVDSLGDARLGAAGLFGAGSPSCRAPAPGRLPLAVACAIAGFLFGAWMDLFTLVAFTDSSTGAIVAISAVSLPFNIAHAVGNFLICLAFGPAFVRMLVRFRLRLSVRWRLAAPAAMLIALCLLLRGSGGVCAVPATGCATWSARSTGTAASARRRMLPSSQLMTGWTALGLEAAGRNPSTGADGQDGDRLPALRRRLAARHRRDRAHDPRPARRRRLGPPVRGARSRRRTGRAGAAPTGRWNRQANWTAFGILALRASGMSRDSRAIRRSADWLARQQNDDGGYSFGTKGGGSFVDETGAALQALAAAGRHGQTAKRARVIPAQGAERGRRVRAVRGPAIQRPVDGLGDPGARRRRLEPAARTWGKPLAGAVPRLAPAGGRQLPLLALQHPDAGLGDRAGGCSGAAGDAAVSTRAAPDGQASRDTVVGDRCGSPADRPAPPQPRPGAPAVTRPRRRGRGDAASSRPGRGTGGREAWSKKAKEIVVLAVAIAVILLAALISGCCANSIQSRDLPRARAVPAESNRFDIVVIGGGDHRRGVALDAATRGYSVAIVEGS